MKTWTYRGYTIERLHPSGMYSTFIIGHGYLRAETLAGLKAFIRDTLTVTSISFDAGATGVAMLVYAGNVINRYLDWVRRAGRAY